MARKPQENPQLDMTPMIDVVFELIIFFVVTIKQQDILSKLNVNRPAPSKSKSPAEQKDPPCRIDVGITRGKTTYTIDSKETTLEALDVFLGKLAKKTSKPEEEPVIITCTEDSRHGGLVKLLDLCYKHNLFSINLMSY